MCVWVCETMFAGSTIQSHKKTSRKKKLSFRFFHCARENVDKWFSNDLNKWQNCVDFHIVVSMVFVVFSVAVWSMRNTNNCAYVFSSFSCRRFCSFVFIANIFIWWPKRYQTKQKEFRIFLSLCIRFYSFQLAGFVVVIFIFCFFSSFRSSLHVSALFLVASVCARVAHIKDTWPPRTKWVDLRVHVRFCVPFSTTKCSAW